MNYDLYLGSKAAFPFLYSHNFIGHSEKSDKPQHSILMLFTIYEMEIVTKRIVSLLIFITISYDIHKKITKHACLSAHTHIYVCTNM